MKERIIQFRQYLEKKLEQKEKQREIQESQEFQDVQNQINELEKKKIEMLKTASVEDEGMTELRQELINYFAQKNIGEYEGLKLKSREKREVNNGRVLSVIGGDIDLFLSLSEVKQTKLKDFAKENKEIKKELMDCIELVSVEYTDIILSKNDL